MKKILFSIIALVAIVSGVNAMTYEQAREEALFLTDKMAYELNLNESQYDAAYEINLDYLMDINDVDDVYSDSWNRRNSDMSVILLDWQWDTFCDVSYFYRPIYWNAGVWHFGVYAFYPQRNYYYFARPTIWNTYRGEHRWIVNGGRSWYKDRGTTHFHGGHSASHIGMRDNRRGSMGHRSNTGTPRNGGFGNRNGGRDNFNRGSHGGYSNDGHRNGQRGYASDANRSNQSRYASNQDRDRSAGYRSNDRTNRGYDSENSNRQRGSYGNRGDQNGNRSYNSSADNMRRSSTRSTVERPSISERSTSYGGQRQSSSYSGDGHRGSSYGGSRSNSYSGGGFSGGSRSSSYGSSRGSSFGGGSFSGGSHSGGGSHGGGGHNGGGRGIGGRR